MKRVLQDQACSELQCFEGIVQGLRVEVNHVDMPRYDLLEVCCSEDSPLATAVEEAGGHAYRMGLHSGYDLATKAGLKKGTGYAPEVAA